ncbi:porin family protein [Arcticibacter eurypsychrophilus]|uniref:hypothetical protein n=1 Tax=Arcticibacter eurypsychrophilus TaxID=1434752 RepID=UPI00084D45DC|nr:hypothetical protein [Arcticibacter eurypsychrophilus]
MSRIFKNLLVIFVVCGSFSAYAQTTTGSAYSKFGIGSLNGSLLPQSRAMGGISAGLRKPGSYNNINLANPASYSSIRLTTFDVGLSSEYLSRSKGGASETDFTGSLSHLIFAVPVNKKSALSFGLIPYSSLGYQSRKRSKVDSTTIDKVYGGDGGLSKFYLGYGVQLGEHLSVGFNAGYVFGKLEKTSSAEFPYDYSAYNSRIQQNSSIGGFNFDYGLQYFTNLSPKVKLTLGYSGSASPDLNLERSTVVTRYLKSAEGEDVASDTTFFNEAAKSTIKLPMMHTAGFTIEKTNNWLIGADFKYGQWKDYKEAGTNMGLQNSYGIAIGTQITPDINSVGSYLKVIDYRLGFRYDKTYININNTDINDMAITLGFGFPLQASPTRTTFYKVNFSAELGQRGPESMSLVRERYVNFSLGFTLNDQWFRKYKFD